MPSWVPFNGSLSITRISFIDASGRAGERVDGVPVALDIVDAFGTGGGAEAALPPRRRIGEIRPQAVLPLGVRQHGELVLFVVKRIHVVFHHRFPILEISYGFNSSARPSSSPSRQQIQSWPPRNCV